MQHQFRVIVAEDEKIIRDNTIRKIKARDPDFIIVGEFANSADALSFAMSNPVDILITDIRMPVMDGLELIKKIREYIPALQAIIISGYADFSYAQQAIRLGVDDYLLKPIKPDLLSQSLQKIKQKLTRERKLAFYKSLCDAIHGYGQCIDDHQNFNLFLLNLGNYCSVNVSTAVRSFYETNWLHLDFSAIRSFCDEYWIVNGSLCNTKFIVMPALENTEPKEIANTIQQELFQQLPNLSITVLFCSATKSCDLALQANALYLALLQNLVIDESRVISIDQTGDSLPSAALDAADYKKLASMIQQEQVKAIKQEVFKLIEVALELKRPQRWVQDYIHQILRLFQRHSLMISEAEFYHTEYELFNQMTLPLDKEALFNRIWGFLLPTFAKTTKETTSEESIEQIQKYIDTVYNMNITLDEIARRFDFSASYLIKVFKKQFGVTPIQYTIQLRMNEAKRLMQENPDMDIKQICELVGYPDQHYFSRIFKNIHGISPTQYISTLAHHS